ncbi:MAG: hypothetical protein MJ237_07080 [bacterium]|nr:hypothetical protein [bacterium]
MGNIQPVSIDIDTLIHDIAKENGAGSRKDRMETLAAIADKANDFWGEVNACDKNAVGLINRFYIMKPDEYTCEYAND